MKHLPFALFFSVFSSFSVFFAASAQADLKKHLPIDCAEHESFIKQIMNCGDNDMALKFANQCSDRVIASARENARALAALMKQFEKGMKSAQNQSQQSNIANLTVAVDVLYEQIVDMQKNTERVADYTLAMIDAPGSESAETSTECFNSAFDALSNVVAVMDKEIVNTIQARKQAISLLKMSGKLHGNLDTVNPVSLSNQVRHPASKAAIPKRPKGKSWNSSDISGTEPEKKQPAR